MKHDVGQASPEACPPVEHIIDVVERGRRSRHYQQVVEHSLVCPTCRATYKDLLATDRLVREARKPFWRWQPSTAWRPALALGMLLLLAVGAWWLLRPTATPEGIHWVQGVPYEGATRLPDWARTAIALYENPPSPVRAGTPQDSSIRLKTPSPRQTAVDTLQPVFEWEALPDATGYRVTLTDEAGRRIPLTVSGARAEPKQSLQEGATYRLQIVALVPDTLPGNEPRLTYEFHTLSAEQRQQLEWARAHARNAPIISAITLYQLGFPDEARGTLPKRSTDPKVQRWKEVLTNHY
ncbi:MAG: hypothetical protein ACUVV1_09610 [Fimbriimonadales bacterium]